MADQEITRYAKRKENDVFLLRWLRPSEELLATAMKEVVANSDATLETMDAEEGFLPLLRRKHQAVSKPRFDTTFRGDAVERCEN